MVKYNPKDWFSLIFKFHKSDTFRKLFWVMVSIVLYGEAIAWVHLNVYSFGIKNLSVIYSLLGFVLSLLLVFRTNTAYDRWWEGRKAWGSLVNSSRSLALKFSSAVNTPAERFLLWAHTSNYCHSLKDHLRGNYDHSLLLETSDFKKDDLVGFGHNPNYFSLKLHGLLNRLNRNGSLTHNEQLSMTRDLEIFTDVAGICERIKRSPIPYSYNLFLKKFIFMYVMSMPFAFVGDFGYGIGFLVVFVFYALASLELIAEEIEDPFGTDANDLPIDQLCQTITKNTSDILGIDQGSVSRNSPNTR